MKSALHGLVEGDRFKLIEFNSATFAFEEDFSLFNQDLLVKADRWIDSLQPRGGTEMLPAVRAALAGDQSEERICTVLLITDGQAHNEDAIYSAVKNRRKDALFFTMGIDTAVNAALLERLARVGGGTCELLTPRDDIDEAVARLESRFSSPILSGVTVEAIEAADPRARVLFAGRPLSFLLEGAPDQIVVKGKSTEGETTYVVESKPLQFPLGALWARERIRWLEDRITEHPWEEESIRGEIIRIGLEHNIASRFTAFVAVDTSVTVDGNRIEIVQPVELPLGWDEAFIEQPQMSAPMADVELRSMIASSLDSLPKYSKADFGFDDFPVGSKKMKSSKAPPDNKKLIAGKLARMQDADGSFGGDVERTVAALIAQVLLGHTRKKGSRKRTVSKAAKWLEGQEENKYAAIAFEILEYSEGGASHDEITDSYAAELQEMTQFGDEGEFLGKVLDLF